MRKRLPRYAGGQVHMSDVDRILLREFQTQGQVGDNISESQLKGLEGAITGSYITPRDVTYTPQEEERFKKLMSGRVGRRFDKGQGAQGMSILQKRFPNMSDTDMMSLIDMYSKDFSMRKYGGSSLPKAQHNFFPGGIENQMGYAYAPDKDKERPDDASDPKLLGRILHMPNKLAYRIAQYLNELYNVEEGESFPNKEKVEKYVNSPFFKSLEQKKRGGAKKKDWIKGAIKNPGALTAAAKRAGAVKKDGTIKKSWLQQQAKKGNSKTARRARLALTLGQMKK